MSENHEIEELKPKSPFDIKRFFIKFSRSYILIGVLLVVFLGGAYLYHRYSPPLYRVIAYLQIHTAPTASSLIGGSPFSSNPSGSQESFADLNGEIFKLQSANLIAEVVDSLRLNIALHKGNNSDRNQVSTIDMPVSFDLVKPASESNTGEYQLVLDSSYYTLIGENTRNSYEYGVPVDIEGYKLTLNKDSHQNAPLRGTYQMRILATPSVVAKYQGRIMVGAMSKGGPGMLQVGIEDELPERGKRIVEVLKYKYDYANYVFKNRALQSEIDFLDRRLAAVNEDLESQENYVKNFKAGNQINDVSSSANQLLGSLTQIDQQKYDNEYKENLLDLIKSNINSTDPTEKRINVNGIQDQDLSLLVGKYNDLVGQKADLLTFAAPKDLRIPQLDVKLQETKNAIRSRVASLERELAASNSFLNKQQQTTSKRFSTLPAKEKDYIQVNRLLNIKQTLYIFLLQKKEDKNIEFASSGLADSRLVDWKISNVQNPKPPVLFAGAGFAALLVSALIVLLKMLLSKKIETSDEIYRNTNLHVIGEVAHAGNSAESLLVKKDDASPITEQFRTLRTNLFYLTHELRSKVCMVTSAVSGEGKSFVALNLASALAISNKKTIILEFDLRYPGILPDEENAHKPGLTDFLAGEVDIEELVHPVVGAENLYFMSAGKMAIHNAGELILSDKMRFLFEYLKKKFEFIIVDTPPVEAVSDAISIGAWADLTLYVVRHKYSSRRSIELINKLSEDSKLPRPVLVVNGIHSDGEFQNVHGYGYGYSNAKGYNKRKARKTGHLKIA